MYEAIEVTGACFNQIYQPSLPTWKDDAFQTVLPVFVLTFLNL